MSRTKFWEFTCDNCGKKELFKSLYMPRLGRWIHNKRGLNYDDFCCDKCFKAREKM